MQGTVTCTHSRYRAQNIAITDQLPSSASHADCALKCFSWQLVLLSWMLATTWTASIPLTKGLTGETRVHGPVLRLSVSIHKKPQTAHLQVMLRSVCAEATHTLTDLMHTLTDPMHTLTDPMHTLTDLMHTLTDPMRTLTDHLSIHNRSD